jgi:hypothetical protein
VSSPGRLKSSADYLGVPLRHTKSTNIPLHPVLTSFHLSYMTKSEEKKVNTEQKAKPASTPQSSALAPLWNLRRVKGRSAPLLKMIGIYALALTGLFALTAGPAFAHQARLFAGSFGSATSTVVNPYPIATPSAVAVDSSSGPSAHDVYVADPENHRVEKFDSSGHFLLMFGAGVLAAGVEGKGDLTAGSKVVSSVSASERSFLAGEQIEGAGIPAETTILDVGVGTLTLSQAATASASGVSLNVAEAPANVPVNERQEVALGGLPSGGTFTLTVPTATLNGTAAAGSSQVTTTNKAHGELHVGDATNVESARGFGTLTAGSTEVKNLAIFFGATGTVTAGSATITEFSAHAGVPVVGGPIEGAGIPAGATIEAVSGDEKTLTISAAATVSGSSVTLTSKGPFPFTVGQPIISSSPGEIPAGTTITAVGPNSLTLSAPALISGEGERFTGQARIASIDPSTGSLTLDAKLLRGGGVSNISTSETTAPLPYNASAGEMAKALEALAGIGAGNVSVSGSAAGPWTVEFKGPRLADANVLQMSANAGNLLPLNRAATVTTLLQGHSALGACATRCQPGTPAPALGVSEGEQLFLAVDSSSGASAGDIYVADSNRFSAGDNKVAKFDPQGNLISSWGTNGLLDGSNVIAPLPGPFKAIAGIAVAPSGNLWVVNRPPEPRTFEFKQDGTYAGNDWAVEEQSVDPGLAVDSSEHVYLVEGQGIGEFTATGTEIGNVTGSGIDASALAVDPSTEDLFVDYSGGAGRRQILRYDSSCHPQPHNPAGCTPAESFASPLLTFGEGVALDVADAARPLYADEGSGQVATFKLATVPDVTTQKPSAFTTNAATLNGTVDPSGVQLTECFFEWGEGEGATYEHIATCEPAAASIPADSEEHAVHAVIPVQAGHTYHYRLVAANANDVKSLIDEPELGHDLAFGPPSIDSTSVAGVASTSATLQAEINPRNAPTSYRFEYFSEEQFVANGQTFSGAAQAPLSPALLGSGQGDAEASQHLQGLRPHTVYRYRVVAESPLANGHEAVLGPVRAFTTQSITSFSLPDNRAWELVSPPNKHGALISALSNFQAAGNGDAMAYLTNAPTEVEPAGYTNEVSVLSGRGAGGWSSRDLTPPHTEPTGLSIGEGSTEIRVFSKDLSTSITQPFGVFTPQISVAASEQTAFLRSDFPSGQPTAFCSTDCYRPLVTGCPEGGEECLPAVESLADVPPGAVFGEPKCQAERILICGPLFLAASPDLSHVVLRSRVALTSNPAKEQLYEWSSSAPPIEALRLLSLLPDGQPAGAPGVGAGSHNNTRGAVSADGSRVVFEGESVGKHHTYLRVNATQEQSAFLHGAADGTANLIGGSTQLTEAKASFGEFQVGQALSGQGIPAGSTIEALEETKPGVFKLTLSAAATEAHTATALEASSECTESTKACTIQLEGEFQLASADGSKIFLTNGDLYEYDLEKPLGQRLTDLTAGSEPTNLRGNVIGASEDGESLYFIAGAVLAHNVVNNGNGPEQAQVDQCEGSTATCNLYVRRGGATTFVATLSIADDPDWNFDLSGLTAHVSPDGRYLAFMSQRPLTGYDNRDAVSGKPDEEVFLYRAGGEGGEGKLVCASCNPTGARPHGVEYGNPEQHELYGGDRVWQNDQWIAANIRGWAGDAGARFATQPRYLSDSGRLFFNSADALAPSDTNGTEDVYEYEPPETAQGAPSSDTCTEQGPTYIPASNGCVDLISSGISKEESAFLDASENGDDVFFLTAAQLSPRDFDTSLDVYDAHVGGGEPEPEKPIECAGDACQSPVVAPEDPTPGSLTFQGPGNLLPPVSAPVKRKAKPLTRAQKLARALRACAKKPRRKRPACERQARRAYGAAAGKAKKSIRGAH